MGAAEERSPVFGVLRNPSMVDYPGRMAGVFFLSGCNFRCGFCHNARLMGRPDGNGMGWGEVEKACRGLRENWVDGAVVTGGEPTLRPEVFRVVERLREWGFAVKLDTNGSRPEVLERLLPLVDYVAMDVKFAPGDYGSRTGFGDVEAIGRSIGLLKGGGVEHEFRTTVLEAWHDEGKMREIGEWVRGAKLHALQAFVPRDDLPDPACRAMPETRAETVRAYAGILGEYVERVEVRGEF